MSSSVPKSFEEIIEEAKEPVERNVSNREGEHKESRAINVGRDIMRESATTSSFSAVTSGHGLDYRDDLQKAAEDSVERAAARFVDYEITELARMGGLDEVRTNEEVEIQGDHGERGSIMEDLYRAFFMMDRLQGGYTDKRPEEKYNGGNPVDPERYPMPDGEDEWIDDQIAAIEESGTVEADNLGALNYQDSILVINDDWISYKRGKKPLGVDDEVREEVYDLLEELGVAR